MTAIEWLIEIYLRTNKIDNFDLEVAKEMEKQQQGYSAEEVKNIMAETWIKCVGNDGNNFKELRDKILEQFKKK